MADTEDKASKKWFGAKTGTMLVMFFIIFGLLGAFLGYLLSLFVPGFSLIWGILIMLALGVIVVCASISSQNANIEKILRDIETNGEDPKLHAMVKELSEKAGIEVPKVVILHSSEPNAHTSTGKAGSYIAVYDSLMDALTDDELKGVIAHEISHIKNGDTFTTILTSRLSNVISVFSKYIGVGMLIGGIVLMGAISGSSSGKNDNDAGGLILLAIAAIGLFMTLIGAVLCIFYPIAAILKLAISRDREYLADKSAGYLTGNPAALALGLVKIQSYKVSQKELNADLADSMIVSHFDDKNIINRIMSTHPPIDERVKRLMKQDKEMNGSRIPDRIA